MKKTTKTAYLVKSYTLGLLSILTLVGCGPTYKATRVHVPHQTAQGQLQIEAKIPDDVTSDQYDTQIDASYTLTENVVLSSGLLVSSYRSNGDDEANQYNEDYSGLHVGAGYNTRLNDWIRVSSLAGLSLQSWSYENTEPATDIDSLELDEFKKFDSTIISPFAQTSLIFGGRRTNLSLSLRVDAPRFDFDNVSPTTTFNTGEPHPFDTVTQLYALSGVIQANVGLFDHWSLFGQFVRRDYTGFSDTTGIWAEFAALYIGVGYMTGED